MSRINDSYLTVDSDDIDKYELNGLRVNDKWPKAFVFDS